MRGPRSDGFEHSWTSDGATLRPPEIPGRARDAVRVHSSTVNLSMNMSWSDDCSVLPQGPSCERGRVRSRVPGRGRVPGASAWASVKTTRTPRGPPPRLGSGPR